MDKNIDRRIKISFRTLNEKQEIEITSAISDYLIWYKINKKKIDKQILKEEKEINTRTIMNFWMKYIGKSENVEKYLEDINVIADVYEFAEKYKNKIFLLKNKPEKVVIHKKFYRTHEQARIIKQLFEQYKEHPKVKEIKEFLNKHGFDEDHLTKEYAIRIINTINKNCKNYKKAL